MLLARVHGHATSTVRHPSLRGMKLAVVLPQKSQTLEPVLALDRLGTRPGDLVMITSDGKHARAVTADDTSPARWTVVGIVDNDKDGAGS